MPRRQPSPFLLLPAVAALLAACATPAGNGQLTIDSVAAGQQLAGTRCIVTSGGNRWDVTTPAALPVSMLAGEVRVTCDRPGFRRSEVLYRPGPPAARPQLGIGVGGGSGNVGVGLGLGLPVGGAYASYPPYLAVEMTPQ